MSMSDKVITRDGSYTLYSKKYNEHYHSLSGAFQEAFLKYVQPCMIKDGMHILDICFGIGYNSCAAISAAKDIKIIAIENDPDVLKQISNIDVPEQLKRCYEIIKAVAKKHYYKDEDYEIELINEDAATAVTKINKSFDAIFLDPFSPKKNPELWTAAFLKEIFRLMKKNATLATYSCARHIRENLVQAGFAVKDGPIVGRRGPSTIAHKNL